MDLERLRARKTGRAERLEESRDLGLQRDRRNLESLEESGDL